MAGESPAIFASTLPRGATLPPHAEVRGEAEPKHARCRRCLGRVRPSRLAFGSHLRMRTWEVASVSDSNQQHLLCRTTLLMLGAGARSSVPPQWRGGTPGCPDGRS